MTGPTPSLYLHSLPLALPRDNCHANVGPPRVRPVTGRVPPTLPPIRVQVPATAHAHTWWNRPGGAPLLPASDWRDDAPISGARCLGPLYGWSILKGRGSAPSAQASPRRSGSRTSAPWRRVSSDWPLPRWPSRVSPSVCPRPLSPSPQGAEPRCLCPSTLGCPLFISQPQAASKITWILFPCCVTSLLPRSLRAPGRR